MKYMTLSRTICLCLHCVSLSERNTTGMKHAGGVWKWLGRMARVQIAGLSYQSDLVQLVLVNNSPQKTYFQFMEQSHNVIKRIHFGLG